MVIPIPQYKDFATISSLKEWIWVTAGSYQPKGSTGLIPGLAAKRLEMINLKLCSMSDAQVVDLV
jgi:hypothetical protein